MFSITTRFNRILLLVVMATLAFSPISAGAQISGYWAPPADVRWTFQKSPNGVPVDQDLKLAIVPLFGANEAQIKKLESEGISAICTINVGYVLNTDPDYDQFRTPMIGKLVWEGNVPHWIDIRNTGVRALMQARMEQAKEIGCKGVITENMELWYNDTGFYISYGDQLVYNRWLADTAHQLGLSIGMHNTFFQVNDLVDWFDFGLVEDCLNSGDCETYIPFLSAGKPVLDIEYNSMSSEVDICKAGRELRFNTIIKGYSDDTTFVDCRDRR
ncbi:MAG: endo alpha-1,4 polygalactosaminidase [Thermomicrobiales bacterium]